MDTNGYRLQEGMDVITQAVVPCCIFCLFANGTCLSVQLRQGVDGAP